MDAITRSAQSDARGFHMTSRIVAMSFVGLPPLNDHTVTLRSVGDLMTTSVMPSFRRTQALRRRPPLNEPSPQEPFVARTVSPPRVQSSQPWKHVPSGERLRTVPGGTRNVMPSSITLTTRHDGGTVVDRCMHAGS